MLKIAVRVGGSMHRLLRFQTLSIAKKMEPSTFLLCCCPGTAFPHVFNLLTIRPVFYSNPNNPNRGDGVSRIVASQSTPP